MAFVNSIEDVQKWFYQINEVTIYIGDSTISIPPERITGIKLKCLYETNFFPVFSITMVIEPSKYYNILKNKKEAYFRLNIGKGYKYNGSEENSLIRNFINQNFSLILDDDDSDSESTTKQLAASNNYDTILNDDTNKLDSAMDNEVEFYLFPTEAVDNSKINVNAILKNCTITDAVCYVLSESNFSNVLMTPLENEESKDLIVIPPMQASKAIQFLDTYYGFYKSGAIYFSDFDYLYILKYNSDCSAYTDDELQEVDIIIPNIESKYMRDICGTIPDSDSSHNIIAISSNLSSRNNSVSINAIQGVDVMTIDNYSGDIQKSSVNVETGSGISNTFIMQNETENEWITDIHTSQSEIGNFVISILLNDIDLSVLKPNKRFKIIYEDPMYTSKYNGIYFISSYDATFVKNGTNLTVGALCVLKKISSV